MNEAGTLGLIEAGILGLIAAGFILTIPHPSFMLRHAFGNRALFGPTNHGLWPKIGVH